MPDTAAGTVLLQVSQGCKDLMHLFPSGAMLWNSVPRVLDD